MSPKEQSKALQLLQQWYTRMYPERDKMTPDERALLEETGRFLDLEPPDRS